MDIFLKWLDIITNLYTDYGILGLIVIVTVCFIIFYKVKGLFKNDNKKNDKEFYIQKPTYNVFFKDIKSYIIYRIPQIFFICKYRTELFRIMLINIFQVFSEYCMEMAEKQVNNLTSEEYKREWHDTINKISKIWHEKLLNIGIFDFVIEEFDKYYIYNEQIIKNIIDSIVKTERVYESNEEKTNAILHILGGILNLVLIDAEKTCNAINGRLKNKTFNMISCKGDVCKLCYTARKMG